MKILVAGWFSFENGHATAGDLLAGDEVCEWLNEAGYDYDIALDAPFTGGVNWRAVNPEDYTHLVFVCGPFEKGELEAQIFQRFGNHCRLIGLNLSMKLPLPEWQPFDFLSERDSSEKVNPDLVFLTRQNHVPVVGLCLVEDYEGAMVPEANALIREFLDKNELAIIPIDTRLDENSTGLRTPAEIESLIARVDVLITTRLHGTVFALKNGIPVVAVDPMAGGKKIRKQCEMLGWPSVFNVDQLEISELQQALEYCLTSEARKQAKRCATRAIAGGKKIRKALIAALRESNGIEQNFQKRTAIPQSYDWWVPEDDLNPEPTPPASSSFIQPIANLVLRLARWSLPGPLYNRIEAKRKTT